MGHHPVGLANVSNTLPAGYRELTSEHLHRPEIWLEEPCRWQAPSHYNLKRTFSSGPLKELNCLIQLNESDEGTRVSLTFSIKSRTLSGRIAAAWHYNQRIRIRLKKLVQSFEDALDNQTAPARSKQFSLLQSHNWDSLTESLIEQSSQPILARKLISMIRHGDEMNLRTIHPIRLTTLWDCSTSDVLHLLFQASSLQITNFTWNVTCDECHRNILSRNKLPAITEPLYCSDCKKEVLLDFHHNIRITFQPHPTVRKLADQIYTGESPTDLKFSFIRCLPLRRCHH